jgi:hypothetical protein
MKQIFSILLVTLVAISFYSCRKEKDTTATVIVVNSAQEPVAGVSVRVYCPSSTCATGSLNENMDREEVTNSSGKVKFNYTEDYQLGQAGFAVLDVEVTQVGSTSPDATGVIKIEEEKENEQTIVCQTCP